MVSHQSRCTCEFELLLKVCWILASEAQFRGHFGPQTREQFRSLVIFSNIFHWFHIILALHAYLGYFYVHFNDVPQGPTIFLGVELWLQWILLGHQTFCFLVSIINTPFGGKKNKALKSSSKFCCFRLLSLYPFLLLYSLRPQTLKSDWIWMLSWKVLDFSICLENCQFSLQSARK